MRDPFRSNSNSQLIREAQIGLTLVAVFMSIFAYVAFHRILGRGRQLPDHVLDAPVAQRVWPGAATHNEIEMSPEQFLNSHRSKRDTFEQDPPTAHARQEFDPQLAANPNSFDSSTKSINQRTEPTVSVSKEATSPSIETPIVAKSSFKTHKNETPSISKRLAGFLNGYGAGNRQPAPASTATTTKRNSNEPKSNTFVPSDANSTRPLQVAVIPDAKANDSANALRSGFASLPPGKSVDARPGPNSVFEKPIVQLTSGQNDFSPDNATRIEPSNETVTGQENANERLADDFPVHQRLPMEPSQTDSPGGNPINDFFVPANSTTLTVPEIDDPVNPNQETILIDNGSETNRSLRNSTTDEPEANSLRQPLALQTESTLDADNSQWSDDPQGNQQSGAQSKLEKQDTLVPMIHAPQPVSHQSIDFQKRIPRPFSQPKQADGNLTGQAISSAPFNPTADQAHAPIYVVREGDSFWSVAQKQYDDPRYFRALYEHNKSTAPNFDSLLPGTRLATPTKTDLARLWPQLCPKEDSDLVVGVDGTKSDAASRIYVTRERDTLFEIARQKLGQASLFSKIHQMNQVRLDAHVDHLSPLPAGIRLVLPRQ